MCHCQLLWVTPGRVFGQPTLDCKVIDSGEQLVTIHFAFEETLDKSLLILPRILDRLSSPSTISHTPTGPEIHNAEILVKTASISSAAQRSEALSSVDAGNYTCQNHFLTIPQIGSRTGMKGTASAGIAKLLKSKFCLSRKKCQAEADSLEEHLTNGTMFRHRSSVIKGLTRSLHPMLADADLCHAADAS